MNVHDEWVVLPHGPIEELAENLWVVQGSLEGMSMRRNMTLARFANGDVLVHSPIALEPPAMQKLESFGPVRYLVVPSPGHRLDAKIYKRRYPTALVVTPRGARERVAEVVPVDLAYDELPTGDQTVSLVTLDGVDENEGALLVRSTDGVTVVLNDVVMNMDPKKDVLGWLLTTAMGSAPGPRVSRVAKYIYIKDREAIRADLQRFAAMPDLVRLVVAHENVERGPNARTALERAMTFL